MSREDPVPHPSGWTLRYASRQAEVGWKQVVSQARNNAAAAWGAVVSDPRRVSDRQDRLKGDLASGRMHGQVLERWQYEITSGGRLWYLIDDETKTLWLEVARTGHPKATERGRR